MSPNDRQALFKEAGKLANQGRFKDAGGLILSRLGITPDDVGSLDVHKRKLVYLAATYFVKGGVTSLAVELFIALGEREKAASLLEQSGDLLGAKRIRDDASALGPSGQGDLKKAAVGGTAVTVQQAKRLEQEGKLKDAVGAYFQLKRYGDAGRILRQLKQFGDAANMYAEGGMAYEAAACYLEVGDTGKGLDNLVRVPRTDNRYRNAAQHAVRIAFDLNVLSFELENFLAEFLRTGPTSAPEITSYFKLSQLYERHNLLENAKEVLKKILAVSSGHKEAKLRLESLEQFSKASPVVYQKIREQDQSYQSKGKSGQGQQGNLPNLPPLPQLTGFMPQASGKRNPAPERSFDRTMAQQFASAVPGSPQRAPSTPSPSSPTEGGSAEDDFVVGSTIQRRYHLDKEIGRGGMAVVFKATDKELDEEIALKVFLQQIADPNGQGEALARFKQELKLSRQLTHQNIIRLYDIGMHRGHRYISMELLDGGDLDSRLGKPIEFSLGLSYLIQACAGLQCAHDKGVVHRDIKPENLFVTTGHQLKVMDFGIAKANFKAGLTMEGMTAGTPHYMAPEQISSFSAVTGAADLYSLGVVAYRMFTGTLPFDSEELQALLMMQITKEPEPPSIHNPNIPKDLDKIIMKLLQKKPEDRFASARELAGYLQHVRKTLKGG